MRAVLDVNVLVAAVLSGRGAPARLLEMWLEGTFELVVSPGLLAELEAVLAYPRVRAHVTAGEGRRLVALLEAGALMVRDPSEQPPVSPSDPDDAYLVALAAAAGAVLVTGDAGLLALGASGFPVVSPGAFLLRLEGTEEPGR